jgi:hypothetical protein
MKFRRSQLDATVGWRDGSFKPSQYAAICPMTSW